MIFGFEAWMFWLAFVVIFLVIEAATVNLTTIWFAAGCLVALVLDLLGASPTVQFIVMLIVSSVLLMFFLLYIKPRLRTGKNRIVATNADRLIGQTAIVTDRIDPIAGKGLVQVGGQVWSAVSESGQPIDGDVRVRIVAIRGVKAVVRPVEQPPDSPIDSQHP